MCKSQHELSMTDVWIDLLERFGDTLRLLQTVSVHIRRWTKLTLSERTPQKEAFLYFHVELNWTPSSILYSCTPPAPCSRQEQKWLFTMWPAYEWTAVGDLKITQLKNKKTPSDRNRNTMFFFSNMPCLYRSARCLDIYYFNAQNGIQCKGPPLRIWPIIACSFSEQITPFFTTVPRCLDSTTQLWASAPPPA